MKSIWLVPVALTVGVCVVLVGAASLTAQPGRGNEPAGRSNAPAEPTRPTLPAKLPDAVEGVVVTNPGIAVAVSRFFRLWQDKDLKPLDVLAEPLSLDGQKTLTATEIPGLVDKMRQGFAAPGVNYTILGMTILPGGNTHEDAQKWLKSAAGARGKAMLDHAEKNKAWLVEVQFARNAAGKARPESLLLAVSNPDSEANARVVGILD